MWYTYIIKKATGQEEMKMTKIYTINGSEVKFTTCTAISSDFPEDGRLDAIYVHEIRDEHREGDGVLFGADFPEDDDDAEILLTNSELDTYHKTLETVEF